MKKRLSHFLLCAGLIAVAALTAFTLPASAVKVQIPVKKLNGEVVYVTVDVSPGTPLSEIVGLPGTPVPPGTPTGPAPGAPVAPAHRRPSPAQAVSSPRAAETGVPPSGRRRGREHRTTGIRYLR